MPTPKKPQAQKTVIVPIKMSPTLREAFRECAEAEGLTLSAWLRRAAILQRKRQLDSGA